MNASELKRSIEKNTREVESRLRQAEIQLTQHTEQLVMVQNSMAADMMVVAECQIEQGNVDDEVVQQLSLRKLEQDRIRTTLENTEARIAADIEKLAESEKLIQRERESILTVLKATPAYIELTKKYTELGQQWGGLKARFDEIETECKSKLSVYEESKFFQYLREAQYGTDGYKRTGFIRFMDGWIAKLCNYAVNSQNEALLRGMREQNKSEAESMIELVTNIKRELDQLCTNAEQASNLKSMQPEKDRLKAQIAEGKKKANECHQELQQYIDRTDSRYAKIRDLLAEKLASSQKEHLLQKVSETKTGKDDVAIARFLASRVSLDALEAETSAKQELVAAARKQYEHAKDLERSLLRNGRYRLEDYDYDMRSSELTSLLAGYMLGKISEDDAIRQVRTSQREIEQEQEPTYYNTRSDSSWGRTGGSSSWDRPSESGSSSWSWPGSSDGGGSRSLGSFGTSDSTGGGSYTTSDSF